MDDNAVMAVLKSSRKARKQTTCYPCQRRKVKCDRGLPCSVCVSRGHSFLCSYGRPMELSRGTSSINSGPEETSPYSDNHQSPPDPQTQLSALRGQLNHLHQELCEARRRHKQCEEAEDQVRRLQARCKEYEDVHVSLRAGDWSALARIDGMVSSDSDTSSMSPDGSVYPQDARIGDGQAVGSSRAASQMTDISMNTSSTHDSHMKSVSAIRLHEPTLCTATMSEAQRIGPPVGGMLNVQQPQIIFEQTRSSPDTTAGFGLQVATIGGPVSYQYEGVPERILQPSAPDPSERSDLLHQIVSGHVQRNQSISTSTRSESHQENSTLRRPLAPGSSLRQISQQEQGGQAFQSPSFFDASNAIVSDPMLEQTEMSSNAAWTQLSCFPPMISAQDLEFMERSYADYWARIVVEAQQSALLAG